MQQQQQQQQQRQHFPRSASAFPRPPPAPTRPHGYALTRAPPLTQPQQPQPQLLQPPADLNALRSYYRQLLAVREALPRARVASAASAALAAAGEARSSPKKRKKRAMTSSERGIKFRRKQQERQEQLVSATDVLRREIERLEALKTMRRGTALVTPFTNGGAPLRFALEYFAQFRFGIAGAFAMPATLATTSAEQQLDFLRAMVAPDALFNGVPAVQFVIGAFSQKNKLASFRVERQSSELLSVDGSAIVVNKGVSHMRYSRQTLEHLFPHVLSNEELVHKLVGRLIRMPFKVTMYFDAHGQLARGEFERDAVTGLYDVLRSVDDCAAVLGDAAVGAFLASRSSSEERTEAAAAAASAAATSATEPERFVEIPDEHVDAQTQAPSAEPMALKFILS